MVFKRRGQGNLYMTYSELGELAKQAVIKVMQEGEKKHPKNDFMKRRISEHNDHAVKHIQIYNCSDLTKSEEIYEITHAMTRLAIILAKLDT